MKKFLLVLLIIIVLVVGGGYFILSTGKSVNVKWTEKDYTSYLQKVGVTNTSSINGSTGSKTLKSKPYPLNASFTSAEISAMVSKETAKTKGPVKNLKIRFLPNNEMEASFTTTNDVKKYLTDSSIMQKYKIAENLIANRPVYVKMKVEKTSSKTISLDLESASVGRIGIPARALNDAQGYIETEVNKQLQSLTNFSMDSLQISDNNASFKGDLQSAPRSLD